LDLGCGTGDHALPLAKRGYQVVGVDRSAGMLKSARKKAASGQVDGKPNFYHGDIRSFHVEQSFDASLMMFAVLGY
jgi:ubiquinone/menaquinone biosynthesis C-methylase UbiE